MRALLPLVLLLRPESAEAVSQFRGSPLVLCSTRRMAAAPLPSLRWRWALLPLLVAGTKESPSPSPPPPRPPTSGFGSIDAWYKEGDFDIGSGMSWTDSTGNGNHATLTGSGFSETHASGNGAVNSVRALRGTTSSVVNFLTLDTSFTICSLTRYSGINSNANRARILTGTGCCHVYHGQKSGRSNGWAYYTGDEVRDGWGTCGTGGCASDENPWLVLCGATHRTRPLLANGVDVGSGTWTAGSYITTNLTINGYSAEKSDFEVVEVMVWTNLATAAQMQAASDYMIRLAARGFSHC